MSNGQVLVCGAKLKGVSGVKLSKQRREQRAKQPCTIITFGVSQEVDTGGEKRKEPARPFQLA